MNNYLNNNLPLSGGSSAIYNGSIFILILSILGSIGSFIYYLVAVKPTTDPVTGKEIPASKTTLYIGSSLMALAIISLIVLFLSKSSGVKVAPVPAQSEDL